MNNNVKKDVKFLTKKIKKRMSDARRRSEKKKWIFNLDFDYLRDLFVEQGAKCFYTGLPFDLSCDLGTMSLDRYDNDIGYLKGNVVWCRSGVNILKYKRSYEKTLFICQKILLHRPKFKIMKDK